MSKIEDFKIKIRLKNRETNEITEVAGSLSDENSGFLQFPIDSKEFEIINIDKGTGKKDDKKVYLYQNDVIKYKLNNPPLGYQTFIGIIEWNPTLLAFTCKVAHNYTHNHLCYCEKIEKLGDTYNNPELIDMIGEIVPIRKGK